jgi:hypothetical protein
VRLHFPHTLRAITAYNSTYHDLVRILYDVTNEVLFMCVCEKNVYNIFNMLLFFLDLLDFADGEKK